MDFKKNYNSQSLTFLISRITTLLKKLTDNYFYSLPIYQSIIKFIDPISGWLEDKIEALHIKKGSINFKHINHFPLNRQYYNDTNLGHHFRRGNDLISLRHSNCNLFNIYNVGDKRFSYYKYNTNNLLSTDNQLFHPDGDDSLINFYTISSGDIILTRNLIIPIDILYISLTSSKIYIRYPVLRSQFFIGFTVPGSATYFLKAKYKLGIQNSINIPGVLLTIDNSSLYHDPDDPDCSFKTKNISVSSDITDKKIGFYMITEFNIMEALKSLHFYKEDNGNLVIDEDNHDAENFIIDYDNNSNIPIVMKQGTSLSYNSYVTTTGINDSYRFKPNNNCYLNITLNLYESNLSGTSLITDPAIFNFNMQNMLSKKSNIYDNMQPINGWAFGKRYIKIMYS